MSISARSEISGSMAAFSSTVSPFGQAAAMRKFSVPVTVDHVGGDARPSQALAPSGQAGQHVAVIDGDFRTHGLQAFDVLIDRARANRAAAGQRHLGAGQSGPAAAPAPAPRRAWFSPARRALRGSASSGGDKAHAAAFTVGFGGHAHVVEQAAHSGHVVQARHVLQVHRLAR